MLVGLPSVAIAAMLADLAGNSTTRPFTRPVFVLTLLWVGGLPDAIGAAVGVIGGVLL
jgi:hypothetical protein